MDHLGELKKVSWERSSVQFCIIQEGRGWGDLSIMVSVIGIYQVWRHRPVADTLTGYWEQPFSFSFFPYFAIQAVFSVRILAFLRMLLLSLTLVRHSTWLFNDCIIPKSHRLQLKLYTLVFLQRHLFQGIWCDLAYMQEHFSKATHAWEKGFHSEKKETTLVVFMEWGHFTTFPSLHCLGTLWIKQESMQNYK